MCPYYFIICYNQVLELTIHRGCSEGHFNDVKMGRLVSSQFLEIDSCILNCGSGVQSDGL